MTNCKVLSFQEIHKTNQFFTDCEECVNKNYRKNLELVEDNALMQQAKVDVLYWKKRAEDEGTAELVNMYERFNNEIAKRANANNITTNPPLNPASNLNTPFNYSLNLPPTPQSGNTPRGQPLSLSDLTGPARVSGSTARVNNVIENAEEFNRRLETPASRGGLNISADVLANRRTGLRPARVNNVIENSEKFNKRLETPASRGGFNISADVLANMRTGLRPTNTRPASAAPASNNSQRAQQSSAFMDELRSSIASRASRGSRRSSVAQLSSPSSSAISNASSVLANVAEVPPPRGRPRKPVNIDLTASEVRGLVGNDNAVNAVNDAVSGSGLKKTRAPAKKKTTSRKKNSLM